MSMVRLKMPLCEARTRQSVRLTRTPLALASAQWPNDRAVGIAVVPSILCADSGKQTCLQLSNLSSPCTDITYIVT